MSKVKISNLKAGACVINSLKQIIPGMASIIKDSSIVDDPDVVELQSLGIISVNVIEDAKPAVQSARVKQTIEKKEVELPQPKNQKTKKPVVAKQSKTPVKSPEKSQKLKPGTDFRAVDGQEDLMGGKVVVMGDSGPEVKRMNPGINGGNGPKYVGDPCGDEPTSEDGFITV